MCEFDHMLNGTGSRQHHQDMIQSAQSDMLARIAQEHTLRTRRTASESGDPLAVRQPSGFWEQMWRLFSASKTS